MNDQVIELTKKPWVIPTTTGVAGLLVGLGAGYAYCKRRFNNFLDNAEMEINELNRERLRLETERTAKELEFHEAITAATEVVEQLKGMGMQVVGDLEGLRFGKTPTIEVERIVQPAEETLDQLSAPDPYEDDDEPDVRSVFGDGDDTWDYETERENRDGSKPYIIHVDEFVGDEFDYDSQSTLVWYEKDMILADSQDQVIPNHIRVVGELKFGHGSNDPNAVYVRNERLKAEYEILRNEGSFQELILGEQMADAELRHAHVPRRMRDWD